MLGSVVRANKTYYPQILLEGYKYEKKRMKWRTLLMMI